MASRMVPSTSPDDQFVAALQSLVEALEHAPRLLAGLARSHDGDLVAALVGHHPEPALDQGEMLPVLAQQQRGQPIVVEGERDLGGRAVRGGRRRLHQRPIVRPCGAQKL